MGGQGRGAVTASAAGRPRAGPHGAMKILAEDTTGVLREWKESLVFSFVFARLVP